MDIPGADIQIEHGNFARVHNAILEALARSKFTQYEFRCLLFLLRKTYGYGQKEDAISLSQWVKGTGIAKPHVSKTLQGLVQKQVITRKGKGRGRGKAAVYGFCKYHEDWGIEMGIGDASYAEEKVRVDVPIKKVHEDVPFNEERVRVDVTEKVRVDVPTKEKKDTTQLAGRFAESYQTIWGMLPRSTMDHEEIVDWSERVTHEAWEYALTECRDRHKVGMWGYLRSILRRLENEGYQPDNRDYQPVNGTVDFVMEEIGL